MKLHKGKGHVFFLVEKRLKKQRIVSMLNKLNIYL